MIEEPGPGSVVIDKHGRRWVHTSEYEVRGSSNWEMEMEMESDPLGWGDPESWVRVKEYAPLKVEEFYPWDDY